MAWGGGGLHTCAVRAGRGPFPLYTLQSDWGQGIREWVGGAMALTRKAGALAIASRSAWAAVRHHSTHKHGDHDHETCQDPTHDHSHARHAVEVEGAAVAASGSGRHARTQR